MTLPLPAEDLTSHLRQTRGHTTVAPRRTVGEAHEDRNTETVKSISDSVLMIKLNWNFVSRSVKLDSVLTISSISLLIAAQMKVK